MSASRDAAAAQTLVDGAEETLRKYLDKDRDAVLRSLIAEARGVLVFPSMVNGGFLFSAGGGSGVMLVRGKDGGWNGPVFFTASWAGFGIQAGVESIDGIMLFQREQDIRYAVENGVLVRGQASVTVMNADWLINRAPGFHPGADVAFVSEAAGLFGGVGVSGGGLADRESLNAAYHGLDRGDAETALACPVPSGAIALRDILSLAGHQAQKKDGVETPSGFALGVSDGT
ncbi:lipid-binding SYLF domain-containing protein [Pseudodesulfovibrio tunisiensis]|uniref:lipid-binding SYLF domain-containing protein n=1 Tax=Pseudodesulfovibrio tunisiensis TaxID=463192 RepID=UPI001FB4A35F|nr:lipid-binding SYLF domain-containing protein [Pseudodesulfovibrio tunisiensis]